jgi:hypothetical protein
MLPEAVRPPLQIVDREREVTGTGGAMDRIGSALREVALGSNSSSIWPPHLKKTCLSGSLESTGNSNTCA